MTIKTTLNQIKSFDPCKPGWKKLLNHLGKTTADDEAFPLVTVLDSNGLDDAIWCLRVCPDIAVEFAEWCAERADAYASDDAVAARYAAVAARYAAVAARASDAATYAATYAACYAAVAARYAAVAARASDAATYAATRAIASDACYAAAADAAARASDAAYAAYAAAYEKERQIQTEKLRELIS